MIRLYQDADLQQLLEVWHKAALIAHHFLGEEFLALERTRIENVYMAVAETWVFVDQQIVVGFIALIGNEVGGLFVDPDFQGQGIGQALLNFAYEMRQPLELDVFKANKIGRRFYERYGFEIVGEGVHEETNQPVLRLRYS